MHVKTGAFPGRLIRMIVLISYTALSSLPSHAQIPNIYAHASLAEKTYLQLDSKVYTTDNTGTVQVVVEAMAANGQIGYQQQVIYDVKKQH